MPGAGGICGKFVPVGADGVAYTTRPVAFPAAVTAEATGEESPPKLSGSLIGRARATMPGRARALAGTSTGSPRTDSIGVASAVFPPYSPMPWEIAPAMPTVPSARGQRIGEPEKPGPMPVRSIAGPSARKRMYGVLAAASPAMTSTMSMPNVVGVTPCTTEEASQRIPGFTSGSGMIASPAASAAAGATASSTRDKTAGRSTAADGRRCRA